MPATTTTTDLDAIVRAGLPLTGGPADLAPLVERCRQARFVLLGEATHGTHEFYEMRAEITRRLIADHGFDAVAVEADWPDADRVNRYVRGRGEDGTAQQALGGFERFPTWMWRNTVVADFVAWLRDHNERSTGPAAGFYGLDLYSLHRSMRAVVDYLRGVDPEAAERATGRYSCFDHAHDRLPGEADGQSYGHRVAFGAGRRCEEEVIAQLVDLQQRAAEAVMADGQVAEDEAFHAERNARLVVNAEEYYRSMYLGRASSWNLRDRHMAETLAALADHLGRQRGRPARIVVWEHNSHLGDARATEMGTGGELNVGQLVRERYGDDAFLLGFTTYDGAVTAARDWGSPGERRQVRPALPHSYEDLFHRSVEEGAAPDFVLLFEPGGDHDGDRRTEAADVLREPRLERAIGVVYRPETERASHYFRAVLADQFDAVVHLDRTRALEPLERVAAPASDEPPETYPSGV